VKLISDKDKKKLLHEEDLQLDDVTLFGMLTSLMTKIDFEGSREFQLLTNSIDKNLNMIEKYFDKKYPNWEEEYEDLISDAVKYINKY
jgi:hypothetical protein